MRRSLLRAFFAALLVVLTASPFTAPFQTFDLFADVNAGVCDPTSKEVAKDCAALTEVGAVVLMIPSIVLSLGLLVRPVLNTPALHSVLRL
jgi:hypothetical protein